MLLFWKPKLTFYCLMGRAHTFDPWIYSHFFFFICDIMLNQILVQNICMPTNFTFYSALPLCKYLMSVDQVVAHFHDADLST